MLNDSIYRKKYKKNKKKSFGVYEEYLVLFRVRVRKKFGIKKDINFNFVSVFIE